MAGTPWGWAAARFGTDQAFSSDIGRIRMLFVQLSSRNLRQRSKPSIPFAINRASSVRPNIRGPHATGVFTCDAILSSHPHP
jgi:hypothetical protein